MKVKIRLARENELKAIQDLNYQLFVHDKEHDPLLNMDWPYESEGTKYFKSRISEKEGVCFVAIVDNKVVGYLAGSVTPSYPYRIIKKQTELENTLVLAEYRSQRIGEQLFEQFIHWSEEQGAERIKVSTAAGNTRAISFYHRVGFEDYGLELEYPIGKNQF